MNQYTTLSLTYKTVARHRLCHPSRFQPEPCKPRLFGARGLLLTVLLQFVKSSSVMSRFWWLAVHVFGAALTLATGLLSQLEKPPSNPTIMSFRSHLEMTAVSLLLGESCIEDLRLIARVVFRLV